MSKLEPLGGIEPPTFALPRRRYTPKPQWQYDSHPKFRFNHYGLGDVAVSMSMLQRNAASD
jgi:hypothetical protein